LIASMTYAVQGTNNISISSADTVTDLTNIHYTGKYCEVCHEKRPLKGGQKHLKYKNNFDQLCKCHNYKPGEYVHPVNIEPSEEKRTKIPADLPLQNGKINCITCHDIYMQCQDNPELKLLNKKFIRGAPFKKRTELCFKCHDDTQYRKLDPHMQLDQNGNIIKEKCLHCHVEKPDEFRATFKDVKLVGDLLSICQRCHVKTLKHPADANHMVMPSLKIAAMMRKTEEQFDTRLPLDNYGKIFCATCHNPHQKGVIPLERAGSRGSSEKTGKRIPGNICLACHEK